MRNRLRNAARAVAGRAVQYFDRRFGDMHERLDRIEIEVRVVQERLRELQERTSIDAAVVVELVADIERHVGELTAALPRAGGAPGPAAGAGDEPAVPTPRG